MRFRTVTSLCKRCVDDRRYDRHPTETLEWSWVQAFVLADAENSARSIVEPVQSASQAKIQLARHPGCVGHLYALNVDLRLASDRVILQTDGAAVRKHQVGAKPLIGSAID